MSNAMRSGKRLLAGLAAGALGAGLITLAAAPAAQASSTAATVALPYPSITAVVSGVNADDTIPIGVSLRTAVGALIPDDTTLNNQRVQVTVTQPVTADDTEALVLSVATPSGAGLTGNDSQSLQTNDTSDLDELGIGVRTTRYAGSNWADLLPSTSTNPISDAGTYTITARLFNVSTGAIVATSTMSLNIIASSASNPASITYISGPALTFPAVNIIDRLGVTPGPIQSTPGDQSFALWVTDSAGGPYLTFDDSVNVTSAKASATITTVGGWGDQASPNPSLQGSDLRIYATGSSGSWTSPGDGTMTATVVASGSSPGRGSASLPVSVSGVQSTTDQAGRPQVILTTPGFEADDNVYTVPPGTTKLNFAVITSTGSVTDTSIPYNAISDVNLTALTPAGGTVVQKADTGAIEITLPAAATASGKVFVLSTGVYGQSQTTFVEFLAPAPLLDTSTPLAKLGDPATINGTITDQYGNALPGTWSIGLKATNGVACTATSIATATAGADGAFTITVPASFSPTLAGEATFGICASNGITTVPDTGAQAANVQYTATGGVSLLTLTAPDQPSTGVTTTSRPLIKTPANGTAVLPTTAQALAGPVKSPTTTDDSATIFSAPMALELTATVSPRTAVTFTGSEGLLFTDRTGGAVFYQQGETSIEMNTTATAPNTANVFAFATKPGLHTVTVTAGTSTATYTLYAAVPNNAARVLTVEPTSFTLAPNSFRTMKFTVKDIFGNAVPFYSGFSLVQAGGGTVSPATGALVTNAAGEAEQFYTAPAGTGDVRLDYTGGGAAGGGAGGSWVTGPIVGAPDAVRTASVNIRVGGSADKSIVIVGERGTVRGKPGIIVDGDSNGFDAGAQFKPWVRFPGQTSYSVGTARPTANATGEFVWQRKTGKKTYVYFTSSDDVVKSNRIIIPAN